MPVNIKTASGGGIILQGANTASDKTMTVPADDGTIIYSNSSGNVGIGTSSPSTYGKVAVQLTGTTTPTNASNVNQASIALYNATNGGSTGGTVGVFGWNSNDPGIGSGIGFSRESSSDWGTQIRFYTHPTSTTNISDLTERARIDSSGNMLVGKTSTSFTVEGTLISPTGQIEIAKSADRALNINRLTNDGNLVNFYQDSTLEGNIAVSGTTVSYNAFAGSHWSQLQDGSKPEILRGTVMESIDELCQWPDEPTSERLCRSKISDTAGSKRVYGVFMDWDNDWEATNDMLVTSLGAFVCRINAGVTVQMGDLLESNGDGTARVQADDVIRSSTIGKVTSTIKTHEYDDGSYCVPTVLYCG